MVELETRPKFRRGEAPGRPIGGNIADTPFTKAFYEVMKEAGFYSQLSLSCALNKSSNRTVSHWLTAKRFPSPREVGEALVVFDAVLARKENAPENSKLDVFLDQYGKELAEREIILMQRLAKGKSFRNPTARWIQNFCKEEKISLAGFFRQIGLPDVNPRERRNFSVPILNDICKGVLSSYGADAGGSFQETIDREIKNRKRRGETVRLFSTYGMKKRQRESEVPLYNGQEAANLLGGKSRETVRRLRKKHGWDVLLTREQVDILGEKIKSKSARKTFENRPLGTFFKEVQVYPLAS